MATATKNYPPNDLDRREKTRKAEKCQLCGTKSPLSDQFTVVNDLENGVVVKKKNAARKGAESLSHYCGDCAGKRVTQKQAWLDGRDESPKPKKAAKAKPAAKDKAAPKAAKGKVKGVKKPAKPAAKATTPATEEDPF